MSIRVPVQYLECFANIPHFQHYVSSLSQKIVKILWTAFSVHPSHLSVKSRCFTILNKSGMIWSSAERNSRYVIYIPVDTVGKYLEDYTSTISSFKFPFNSHKFALLSTMPEIKSGHENSVKLECPSHTALEDHRNPSAWHDITAEILLNPQS